jgi:ankyrin repeat protein
VNKEGWTALHVAAGANNLDALRILLDARGADGGAIVDVNARSNRGSAGRGVQGCF